MHPAKFRHRRTALAATLALGLLPGLAMAQAQAGGWPSKPIQILIPYSPGGSVDLLARPLATRLQERLGQPVVLEYKPGAGGILASQTLVRAKPDGHTFAMVIAAHAINESIQPKLPYDTRKDFAPVSLVANMPLIVVGSKTLTARNIPELIAQAKARPGTIAYGSAGNGNASHLAVEQFSTVTGAKFTHVPFKGSAGIVNALLSGDIQFAFDSISTSYPHVKDGKLSVLATTGEQRSAVLPQVSTIQEQGVKGFEVSTWYALLAPAGVPQPVVDRMSREIAAALAEPALKAQLTTGGYVPVGSTPDALKAHIDQEITRWAKVVKDSGAKVD
jgi:tripartite-type tricarboxylate transporter receptor subunit TctC